MLDERASADWVRCDSVGNAVSIAVVVVVDIDHWKVRTCENVEYW